ncbi:MAG TPA: hypothetical protein VJ816_08860 [Gemmatimonadales bacterium]|nr:hypothetical protein [Gemmatimonadales bacterium]
MRDSLLPTLGLATLMVVLPGSPSYAAPGHVRYKQTGPMPAWTFGIEYGRWANAADPVYDYPFAQPPGRLIVRYPGDAVFELSAMRMWRRIAMRASLSRAGIGFGVVDTVAGRTLSLGNATCDQLRLSALFPVLSIWRSDDRRPGKTHWILGLLTGPTVGWTRLTDARVSAPGAQYAGLDRLSAESGLQAGWQVWVGGPLWFDGPLSSVLVYFDCAVVGFGRDLLEYRTTPTSPFSSGGSRVTPATMKIGFAYLRRLESARP